MTDQLYRARGAEVNPQRPVFTGDVFDGVTVSGVQRGRVMILEHPCAIRDGAKLRDRLLAAAVDVHEPLAAKAWANGHYGKMPLPDLDRTGVFQVARFDDLVVVRSDELLLGSRAACLSDYGINLLQQRLVWHLTRLEVPTSTFHEAFAHTLDEAELLEEWNEVVCASGCTVDESTAAFETFLRNDLGGGKTLQHDLRNPQHRSAVRRACRAEAERRAAGVSE